MPENFAVEQNNASGRVSLWQKDARHGMADGRGVSLAAYIHALYGLLRQAKAGRVLMIGCGGGTLASMLRLSRVDVTIVDIDPASFEIARRYFQMPGDIACHVGDGRAFLRRERARYDAIVLDAYDGGAIPKQFLTPAFFRLAKSRLRPGGMVLVNVIGDRAEVCALLRTAWRHVRLLDAAGAKRNAIAVAGQVRMLRRPRLLLPPKRSATRIAKELKALTWA